MALTLRDLLPKVLRYRPDLAEEEARYAILEAARRVARDSEYLQEEVTATVTGGTQTFTPTPSNSNTLVAVHRVRYLDTSTSTYHTIPVLNRRTVDATMPVFDYGTALYPSCYWIDTGGTGYLYPAPTSTITIKVRLSYQPVGDISTVSFPVDGEEAVVAYAIGSLLELPGPNQNVLLAREYQRRGAGYTGNLRYQAEFGESGSPEMRTNQSFVTRKWGHRWHR